jgi:hypothetical protein
LETVTNGIESSQLDNLKTQFDEIMDKILVKYDFLDPERKNVFKLALANKILT